MPLTFDEYKNKIMRLKGSWSDVHKRFKTNTALRNIDFDVAALQRNNDIGEDETMIAMRLIDTTIKREKPTYIGFLTQPNRLAVFKTPKLEPTDYVEREFTRCLKYLGWQTPHFKLIDGFQTHGYAAMEIVFDESKPGHVGLEYVGPERLMFATKSLDLQQCTEIVREYDMSTLQLEQFIERFGWNSAAVKAILDKVDPKLEDKLHKVYKVMFKEEGKVKIGWLSLEADTGDWLKSPEDLYLGVDNVDEFGNVTRSAETAYPLVLFFYDETEKPTILDHEGRVFFDKHYQEAQSCIATGFVNKLLRAANLYAAVESTDIAGGEPRQLDTKLQHGAIYDKPVKFFSSEDPSPTAIQALSFFDAIHSQEANQVSYAATNRQDTRKTATEIAASTQEAQQASTVSVTNYSDGLTRIWNACWRIIRSRALANKIVFCFNEEFQQNDTVIITKEYNVVAAGDADVVEKQQKIQMMMQFIPIVAQTKVFPQFMAKLLDFAFPDETFGQDLLSAEEDQKVAVIRALNKVLEPALTAEEIAAMPPEQQEQIKQIQAQTAQYL